MDLPERETNSVIHIVWLIQMLLLMSDFESEPELMEPEKGFTVEITLRAAVLRSIYSDLWFEQMPLHSINTIIFFPCLYKKGYGVIIIINFHILFDPIMCLNQGKRSHVFMCSPFQRNYVPDSIRCGYIVTMRGVTSAAYWIAHNISQKTAMTTGLASNFLDFIYSEKS